MRAPSFASASKGTALLVFGLTACVTFRKVEVRPLNPRAIPLLQIARRQLPCLNRCLLLSRTTPE